MLHLFDQKCSKNCNIVIYNSSIIKIEYILKCNLFLWRKAEFSASLLQSSVSHDPLDIILICWFTAQETIIYVLLMLKTVQINIFVEIMIHFFWFLWWTESSKTCINRNDTKDFLSLLDQFS